MSKPRPIHVEAKRGGQIVARIYFTPNVPADDFIAELDARGYKTLMRKDAPEDRPDLGDVSEIHITGAAVDGKKLRRIVQEAKVVVLNRLHGRKTGL